MAPQPRPPANRRTYFITFFALVHSVLIYIVLCFLVGAGRGTGSAPTPTPSSASGVIIPALALLALAAAVLWLKLRTAGRSGDGPTIVGSAPELMTPEEFQKESIVSLALAEACVICGLLYFFMGGPATGILPYAAGTLLVDLGVVLPAARRYWAAYDAQQGRQGGPFNE